MEVVEGEEEREGAERCGVLLCHVVALTLGVAGVGGSGGCRAILRCGTVRVGEPRGSENQKTAEQENEKAFSFFA